MYVSWFVTVEVVQLEPAAEVGTPAAYPQIVVTTVEHAACPTAEVVAVFVVKGTGHAGHSVGPCVLLASVLYVWAAQFAHAFAGVVENWPRGHTV